MTFTQPQAAAFSTEAHVQTAAQLSPAEAKQLAAVKSELDSINALGGRWQTPRMGLEPPLDIEIAEACSKVEQTPTGANAEKLATLVFLKGNLAQLGSSISGALKAQSSRAVAKLEPLALRILEDAEAAFVAEAKAHRAVAQTQTTFAAPAADFEARVQATQAAFAEKKRWIREESAAAHFLMLELGLGI